MSDTSKSEEFYKKLKAQLLDTTEWPSEYLFKFIVNTETSKLLKIETFFDNSGAVIKKSESKTGKYTSMSINVVMKDPDAVIAKYILVSDNVEGVISL